MIRCGICDGLFDAVGPSDDWGHNTITCSAKEPARLRARIAELEVALRNLVADVDDYERVNNLHSWQSMRHAKEILTAR